jgi:2-polyprenyl-3-methyl-5-hydroxy-6-metoxy-1,4-benzoquinol methylase
MTNSCPICGNKDILDLVEIQNFPILSNVLWKSREEALNVPRGDIHLVFCPACGHTYNLAFEPEKILYNQGYENSLHFSARFQDYAVSLAKRLIQQYSLKSKDIIEIGSGQGDFLTLLCRLGKNRCVGFDPSYIAHKNGNGDQQPVFVQDLYSETYKDYPIDFLVCRQVLEHIENPADFLAMVRNSIKNYRNAVVFFEVPNVEYTLCKEGIWDILYEHVSYFSAHSLAYVFSQAHFQVLEVRETFGEQFLTIEAMASQLRFQPFCHPDGLKRLEQAATSFADLYSKKVNLWLANLERFGSSNRRAVIWGAGTKGISFVNTLSSTDLIEYVVDINPRKKGSFITGTGHQIVLPEELKTYSPDAIILMNANYENEVRRIIRDLGVKAEIFLA